MSYTKGFEHYLLSEEGKSPATVKEYLWDVRAFERFLEKKEWHTVDAKDLRAYLAEKKPSPRRSHRIIASLRKFFNYLVEVEGLLPSNPMLAIKRPKIPQRLPKYLQPHEVAKLLEVAHQNKNPVVGLRNWATLAFLYGTGLRISEMLALKFSDINYEESLPVSIKVIGKGNKERVVSLSPTAQRALHQWLKHRKLEGDARSAFVWSFTTSTGLKIRGKPFSKQQVQKMLRTVATQAGFEGITPHKLRHSYASALVEVGRGIEEVKELLGHTSIATTQIYTHVSTKKLAEAARALPDVLG